MIRAKHCTESNNRLLITTIQITILQVFNLYLSNIKEKKTNNEYNMLSFRSLKYSVNLKASIYFNYNCELDYLRLYSENVAFCNSLT